MQRKSARRVPRPLRRLRQVPLLAVTPVRRLGADGRLRARGPRVRCVAAVDTDADSIAEPPPEGVLPTGADADRGANLLPPEAPDR